MKDDRQQMLRQRDVMSYIETATLFTEGSE